MIGIITIPIRHPKCERGCKTMYAKFNDSCLNNMFTVPLMHIVLCMSRNDRNDCIKRILYVYTRPNDLIKYLYRIILT